jgi:hypothetical protein
MASPEPHLRLQNRALSRQSGACLSQRPTFISRPASIHLGFRLLLVYVLLQVFLLLHTGRIQAAAREDRTTKARGCKTFVRFGRVPLMWLMTSQGEAQ